jgi:hypothetical protein
LKIVTTTLILAEKIYRSKIEGVDPFIIQKMQQEWDEQMANSSKAKGTGYENELVKKLEDSGFKKVKRAWGSDGRSMGEAPDVDILADGIKIQAKRRKSIPKWMSMGNCDVVMYREDRGITFVSMTYDDWIRCLKSVLL